MKFSIDKVFDILSLNLKRKENPTFVNNNKAGTWVHFSTSEFIEKVNHLSKGLVAMGIQKGDSVSIMSPNRAEWNICDFAIMQIGAYVVPIYPTMSSKDIDFILKDADVKLIFVNDPELYQKVKGTSYTGPIYSFEPRIDIPFWQNLIDLGIQNAAIDLNTFRNQINKDSIFTLIYTSGTTGTPKGVMLTHSNMTQNVHYCSKIYPKGIEKSLSFLPISHVFERMVVYMYFYKGTSIYYAESLDTIIRDIQSIKPETFTCVPRLLEKVYNKIMDKGKELKGIKKKLFFWALALANEFELEGKSTWYLLQLKIARKLIFKKWQEALGGNIKVLISGGAALNPKLTRIFWAANIQIFEGYGLTETSPVATVNQINYVKFGSVGIPIKGVAIKIAADGEILIKGHNVMKGYYKRPDFTAEVIDEAGWFHSGDIGEITPEGFLCITDRKKEMFKTAGGKYIAPQKLENKYKESFFIEQIMVVGENRRFPSALIVPNFEALSKWCQHAQIPFEGKEAIIKQEKVIELFDSEIKLLGKDFGKWEQIKKIILLAHEWTIEKTEITPKMSLKRKVIYQNHLNEIEALYIEDEN